MMGYASLVCVALTIALVVLMSLYSPPLQGKPPTLCVIGISRPQGVWAACW